MSQELIDVWRSGKFVDCAKHIHFGSCEYKALNRMANTIKIFVMLYGPAHLLPVFIFKLKQLTRNPVPILSHAFENMARSITFGVTFIGITQYGICQFAKLFNGVKGLNWIFIGILSAMTIFIEAPSRRGELTLYLLPRVVETLWNILKKKGIPIRINYFEVGLFAFAMGALSYFLYNDDKNIKPTYRSSLRIIFGNN